MNSSSDTDFLVAVNATYDEELPQLGWRRTGNPPALELLLTSPGRRRLELEATSDWAAWHRVAGFWLEGTTNLVGGFDGAATARFIRILAY
ncbi:MAG: hypothetical protein M5U12_11570 [Verrucomicrobia bacterium]|nr:hypothetical protein [Verrucomicrobiota bacterium]